jgi:hypothetical protein
MRSFLSPFGQLSLWQYLARVNAKRAENAWIQSFYRSLPWNSDFALIVSTDSVRSEGTEQIFQKLLQMA